MLEVRGRGEQVIRRDMLINQHGLNERQAKALGFLIQHGKAKHWSTAWLILT